MNKYQYDVVIMGGGLAGLTLAQQLTQEKPELSIAIIEKNCFPVPEGIAKVGESTVEIGSHYLTNTIGLKPHLETQHLKKFGIRCFFGSPQQDFSQQDELGASQVFNIPTYQIDRGVIENHLASQLAAAGVTIMEDASITDVNLSSTEKLIALKDKTITGKWLVDCAGRQFLLKNKLQLQKHNNHKGNAVWFRIDRRIEIDDWSDNAHWQTACQGRRWLSTNHLMGPGYWVWIIPLASGVTSIGIVMDDTAFNESDISDKPSAMRWLKNHQGRLAERIAGAQFLDFTAIRNYSYACKQTLSSDGWGISGEAGFFADPFYSPGTDFIAFSNMFLSSLITKSFEGKNIQLLSAVYQKTFRSIYENTLSIYQGEYGGFGDRKLMGLKLLWDYSYYWGVLSVLFFSKAFTHIEEMRTNIPVFERSQHINNKIQALFRERAQQRQVLPCAGVFMNQFEIPCLKTFNEQLSSITSPGDFTSSLAVNIQKLNDIAECIENILANSSNVPTSNRESELLGDYRKLLVA